jgi:hypothetical protein
LLSLAGGMTTRGMGEWTKGPLLHLPLSGAPSISDTRGAEWT